MPVDVIESSQFETLWQRFEQTLARAPSVAFGM